MSDQYEKGVLKVLRYVYNQMERCRNADFDALGITSSQASVMMFLFKNRKHEVTQQSVQAALLLSHPIGQLMTIMYHLERVSPLWMELDGAVSMEALEE